MMPGRFAEYVRRAPVMLTEGALVERLRRDAAVRLDPDILHAGFVYDAPGRAALEALYREYLDVGQAADLPLILGTPTWRANPLRLQRAGLADRDVNGDGARFVAAVRQAYGAYARKVFIGGLLGCQGDAYQPAEGLTTDEAARFAQPQAQALAAAGVDFLFAATLPHAPEAVGIARAMATCPVPSVLSVVVRADGALLDGTPLHEVVARIDTTVSPRPVCYLVNCVHPTTFAAALQAEQAVAPALSKRLIGLQANASSKGPEELDGSALLDADPPAELAKAMLRVHRRFGTRILGGCCGTDSRHIAAIARQLQDVTHCEKP